MLSRTTTRAVCTASLPRLSSTQARPACAALLRHAQNHNSRTFTSTGVAQKPHRKLPELKLKLESEFTHTEPAWPHPVYTTEQMEQIVCLPLPLFLPMAFKKNQR
jgi:hypothetical protein